MIPPWFRNMCNLLGGFHITKSCLPISRHVNLVKSHPAISLHIKFVWKGTLRWNNWRFHAKSQLEYFAYQTHISTYEIAKPSEITACDVIAYVSCVFSAKSQHVYSYHLSSYNINTYHAMTLCDYAATERTHATSSWLRTHPTHRKSFSLPILFVSGHEISPKPTSQ